MEKVVLYSLTTCVYCKSVRKLLEDLSVEHECLFADEFEGEEKEALLVGLKKANPNCTFPTLVIGDEAVVGYQPQEVREKLGIRTEADDLYDRLKKVNEPTGYHFNAIKEMTFDLIRNLLVNKDRYGYMSCPCRLATGERDKDKDIICPCDYREEDIKKYGSCFCGLYVSEEWNTGRITRTMVPERRSMRSL